MPLVRTHTLVCPSRSMSSSRIVPDETNSLYSRVEPLLPHLVRRF